MTTEKKPTPQTAVESAARVVAVDLSVEEIRLLLAEGRRVRVEVEREIAEMRRIPVTDATARAR